MAPLLFRTPGDLSAWLLEPGWLLLMFAPGAWITFGSALQGIPFWARLFTGTMLSPLIVSAEFYAIRLMGVPFGPTAVILVILNLPPLYLIWKRRGKVAALQPGDWLVAGAALAIPLVCMSWLLMNVDARIFAPHGWPHADAVYMFARGALVPEDPTLAGMGMAYPVWSPLAFQAVESFLLNTPPVASFAWSNLLWLVVVCGFAAGIAKEMGGGRLAQGTAGIWLLLGTNPVGYILMKLAPGYMSHELWGDPRYTPWALKFLSFTPMTLALGMLIAMVYLLVRPVSVTKGLLAVVCLLLSGIGLLYPLLFPPACGVIVARALAPLASPRKGQWSFPDREWLAWAGILLVALMLTASEIRFITADRRAPSPVVLSSVSSGARKIVESLIVTSVLLAGLAFTVRHCWKSRRTQTAFLVGGALASCFLYVAFFIPYYENEYKFVFAVVMCLAVFPAIAMERIWREWPRSKAVPVLAALALLLFGTYGHFTYAYWPAPWLQRPEHFERRPLLAPAGFFLQMDPRETWSGICNAVLRMTPPDSILVLNNAAFYYPGLTARSLYASPADKLYAGVNLPVDDMDNHIRGYGLEIVHERRATLADFFDSHDTGRRERAIQAMLRLKRPVAIIAEPQNAGLAEWLKQRKTATRLYDQNGLSLWLIDEAASPQAGTFKPERSLFAQWLGL
jgi:hypothetical protein